MPSPLHDRGTAPAATGPLRGGAWWMLLIGLWALATAADRLWLGLDRRLPSWDQADYLNSAVDHGRALGLLPGGGWRGWQALLDLSPKIPPLASLVNGTVMAVAGDAPDAASWTLALWHAVLLVVVALWGRQLGGRGFGLLAAALTACAPALAALRVDYTLDLPLAAVTTLALWLLGRWQAPAPRGGHPGQAVAAALAVAAAVLVKQSALLVVLLPSLWAGIRGLGEGRRRLQVLLAAALVLGLAAPWLHHNWISTLGGTNRAVVESAASEGDPPSLSLASLLWYPLRWPGQLGPVTVVPAVGAGAAAAWRARRSLVARLRHPVRHLPPGWPWLIGCAGAGWLFTTLSPNKDARYIAPVLPLLALIAAAGWWWCGQRLADRRGPALASTLLGVGVLGSAAFTARAQAEALMRRDPAPVEAVVAELRRRAGDGPLTLVVVPSRPDVNEQTLTTYGRLGGGRILARRLGRRAVEHPAVLGGATWILLATGDQGTDRPAAQGLSRRIRSDGRFERVAHWPWRGDQELELWRRREGRAGSPSVAGFDADFIALARGMEKGPAGLAAVFARIGTEHQLDGHFLYQERVESWARARLARDPRDADALWSLALLATLRNRPGEAAGWFGRLQALDPALPWPAAYGATVRLADWNPRQAVRLLEQAPPAVRRQPVVRGLEDLSRVLGGNPLAIGALRISLPEAIREVERQLERPAVPDPAAGPPSGHGGTGPPPS